MHSRRNQPPALRLKTPSSPSSSSSAASSPPASLLDDHDTSTTTTTTTPSKMSSSEYVPARPLTVTIPKGYAQGPYCIRRPNLSEILANTGSPPWTLSAFMAYLSQNHCLETLEFTMDASRYKKHYDKMVGANPEAAVCPESDQCNFVRMLWQRLLDAYIAPNGPREVNLPSDVRDGLLEKSHPCIPPHPSTLDTAVRKIYELMEESVLVPFLNSLSPQSAADSSSYNTSDENLSHSHTRSYDERALRRDVVAQQQSQPSSAGPQTHRASAPSSLTSSFSNVTRNFGAAAHARFASASHFRHPHSAASSTAASPSDREGLTDDSTASSPSAMGDPMTPPTTPPMSDYGCPTAGSTPSPGNSRESSSWKRMSSRLGWKKRSSGHMRQDHADQQQMEGGMF
ncbi:RGS domain-containing protein [Phyllosticta citriasiana]|uniref:RGS domain-containing protein n=1 Tax=Phyllosticta citriasiana TaxID=595635 RepID=UPI0030FD22D1